MTLTDATIFLHDLHWDIGISVTVRSACLFFKLLPGMGGYFHSTYKVIRLGIALIAVSLGHLCIIDYLDTNKQY